MRAVVATRFGGPEVLEEKQVETPKPGSGQVLVRIVASATNPLDAKLRQDGSWAGLQPPFVPGYDASGVIEEVGPCVVGLAVGDEVYYTPEFVGNRQGTYAEYEAVHAAIVAQKPRSLSHEEAAAVPLAGGTAWDAVVRRLKVSIGETVLIHGGTGGVGSFAVQLAKACGARVLASAGADHQDTLRQLGADVTIDYQRQDPAEIALEQTNGAGVDAVFDTVGRNIIPSLRATRPFGRLATILAVTGDLTAAYVRNLTIHGIMLTRERARLEQMARVLERRQVRPLIDAVLPLGEVRKAHQRLDTGHGRGKIVLRVAAR